MEACELHVNFTTGSGFRIEGLGFRFQGFGFRDSVLEFRVWEIGLAYGRLEVHG